MRFRAASVNPKTSLTGEAGWVDGLPLGVGFTAYTREDILWDFGTPAPPAIMDFYLKRR